jgi:hypothetical protein
LSRRDLKKATLAVILVFTMFFSGGLVPTYLVVRRLGMVNTVWAMLIPGAISTWRDRDAHLFQTTILTGCGGAFIDGSNNVLFLTRASCCLSGPVIASWCSLQRGPLERLFPAPLTSRTAGSRRCRFSAGDLIRPDRRMVGSDAALPSG